ncbi:MAG: hypothetical protein IJD83_06575 [Clostridia bacterium]|nr:hypothetical protein [Clostridia bacterium]
MYKDLSKRNEKNKIKELENKMEFYRNSYLFENGCRMGLQQAYNELLNSCDTVVKGKFGLLVSYGISITAIVLSVIKLLK